MTLAHETIRPASFDDRVEEEEFFDMVSREELRTMMDQVSHMYQGWDKVQLELAKLNRSDTVQTARLVGLEGRMALIERGQGQSGVSMAPGAVPYAAASAVESAGQEVTERRQNVRVPIPRATELLDKERVADEMVARYMWWSKKARALGVTARQVAWGFVKEASKYAAAGSIGWAIHRFWPW